MKKLTVDEVKSLPVNYILFNAGGDGLTVFRDFERNALLNDCGLWHKMFHEGWASFWDIPQELVYIDAGNKARWMDCRKATLFRNKLRRFLYDWVN